jgi:hypothetical protein
MNLHVASTCPTREPHVLPLSPLPLLLRCCCLQVTAVLSVPLLDVSLLCSLVPLLRRRALAADLVFLESYKAVSGYTMFTFCLSEFVSSLRAFNSQAASTPWDACRHVWWSPESNTAVNDLAWFLTQPALAIYPDVVTWPGQIFWPALTLFHILPLLLPDHAQSSSTCRHARSYQQSCRRCLSPSWQHCCWQQDSLAATRQQQQQQQQAVLLLLLLWLACLRL